MYEVLEYRLHTSRNGRSLMTVMQRGRRRGGKDKEPGRGREEKDGETGKGRGKQRGTRGTKRGRPGRLQPEDVDRLRTLKAAREKKVSDNLKSKKHLQTMVV